MMRILPVNSCRECPKFHEENDERMCSLSKVKAYDLDEDWESYLEQFCPLEYLENIINDAYERGKLYKDFNDETLKTVRKSIEEDKWHNAHNYLEKIMKE